MGDYQFTVFTETSGTNIWQSQILGLDLNVFYALIIVVLTLAAIVAILVWRNRMPQETRHGSRAAVARTQKHPKHSAIRQHEKSVVQ
jgi:uncharacterized iron-regulated membrane protein